MRRCEDRHRGQQWPTFLGSLPSPATESQYQCASIEGLKSGEIRIKDRTKYNTGFCGKNLPYLDNPASEDPSP